jgi:hypothetical protein
MKISMGRLRDLLNESAISRLLTEEDDSMAHEEGAAGDSLDNQVDRYLISYETDAKKAEGDIGGQQPSVGQMEALDWRDLIKGRVLITEAGQADKDAQGGPEDAAPGADEMTGEDTDKLGPDALDVEKFANDVVRLVENYDSLLEVRSTLIRRAISFLKKNYNDEVTKSFEDVLRDVHGMEAGTDPAATAADKFVAPPADRASGSAQAGIGGGGAPPV